MRSSLVGHEEGPQAKPRGEGDDGGGKAALLLMCLFARPSMPHVNPKETLLIDPEAAAQAVEQNAAAVKAK